MKLICERREKSLSSGDMIAKVAARHGLTLKIATRERVPVRAYRRPLTSSSRFASASGVTASGRFARRRGRLTLISWAKK